MNEFEQLKNNWNAQPLDGPSSSDYSALKNKIKGIAKKQRITNVVLILTIAVLVLFFIYIGAIHFVPIAFALATMILVLVLRIWIEVVSITRLKKIVGVANVQNFKENLKKYYKNRVLVHLVVTPLLLGIYAYAFWTLLPGFKASLSSGFYNYIVYSSIILLIFFIFFIGNEVKKELRVLQQLKRD